MKSNERDREYDKAYNKKRYQETRNWVIEQLGFTCWACRGVFDPRILEVLPKEGMKFPFSKGGTYLRSKDILRRDLIPLARLLCKNCHRIELVNK